MTSSGNIPWLPIRRYINRMQQSYLLLSTPYIFIPSYFISFLTFPSYNSSIYPIIHSSFHIHIYTIIQKYLPNLHPLHFQIKSNQNKFHPLPIIITGGHSCCRRGRRQANTRSESTISTERKETSPAGIEARRGCACAPPLNFQPTEERGGVEEEGNSAGRERGRRWKSERRGIRR